MTSGFPAASQNQLKRWARLTQAKFRLEDGLFLAEGVKVVDELLKSPWQAEALLVLREKNPFRDKIIPLRSIPVYELLPAEFKKLSQDKEPEGIAAVVKMKEPPSLASFLKSTAAHLLIGHEISNPQNLGALLRTARWFGFSGMILGTHCVDWTNPKVIRASMGAVFHLAILADMDLPVLLGAIQKDYTLIGSDVHSGIPPHPVPSKAALLLGSESHGLPDDLLQLADCRWRIPGDGGAESLSLPQAAAIMMYEMRRQGDSG
jgi:TrmH family RNA methyltransferase